ncbi:hypothetical protein MCOR25_007621 [Pyricularia grisea]|uniref:Uncharacterized protein n=1 Tax=Pyricularia grisea TaxID=148305 RepID=A0A6P8BCZ6_PYRGI|nr:uncharacterized protein PgNI_04773 [Pyricularia grisea]KAI6357577.1 hypothetical protein MCOR25_007621 [Pyricularia grisea]TLD13552.1 hypothetical protein PgNI_04773 [Pyricularia grisea]
MLLRIPRSLSSISAQGLPSDLDTASAKMHIKRAQANSNDDRGINNSTAYIVASIICGIVLLGILWILIRSMRARYPEPKYIPTPFLKGLWTRWTPSNLNYQRPAAGSDNRWGGASRNGSPAAGGNSNGPDAREPMRSSAGATAAVDRHASVRSIMTLPAYRTKANDGEEVLGVAGERDGIDVVVEMPTAEQEEAMRDEEMDALFQIRQARRRQMAEREERYARREQARTANDVVAMRAIRNEAREARAQNTEEIEALRVIQEQTKLARQRAVSAVSYAGIGEVRHDGTRARANSQESERTGLLSDAASIALSSRPSTSLSARTLSSQGRQRSGSELSIETARSRPVSPGFPTGGSTISRASSRSVTPTPTPRRLSHAGSSPELIDAAEADLGEGGTLPPDYEEINISDGASASVQSLPSGRNTPLHEPPPEYTGPTRNPDYHRMSRHVADLLASSGTGSTHSSPDLASNGRGSGSPYNSNRSTPQLPSISLQPVPQIVIEPSTARSDNSDRQHF